MKAHRIDGISLAFGLILLAIVAAWAIVSTVNIDFPAFGWFVAVALIAFGVVGLVTSLRLGRRRTPEGEVPPDSADRATDPDLATLNSIDTDKP
jgi:hypothetical protein